MILSQKDRIILKGSLKRVYKAVGRAIVDYNMISAGDKLLVAVSGGLDSLCLLNLLLIRKERLPIKFDIVACFIKTNFINVDQEKLIQYFKANNVEYVIDELFLDEKNIDCFWCSWNRRKKIFMLAEKIGCKKVVLGHNMDDIVETTLLNFFFNGEISTMKPKIELFGGKLTIIRPLCYVEKKDILDVVRKFNFPDTQYQCPFAKNSKRELAREIIKSLEKITPTVKKNIFRALDRIKKDYLL